jgi:arabinose-5-phosphate isomerase
MGRRMVLKNQRHRNQEFADLAFSYSDTYEFAAPMNAQMQAAPLPLGHPALDGTVLDGAKLVRSAHAVIATEARAIEVLHDRIDGRFLRACQLMYECAGRVVVSGMGKSGHIARKIAATLASTGTPSFFVHPAEASHGDLGMITQKDVVLALSNSGETDELLTILPLIKRQGIPLIVMSGNSESSLGRLADVHLDTSVPAEACPLGLAPTASTTATLVMGDALAIALLEARGFTDEDFARSHPAGSLGRQLLLKISDVMHRGEQIPAVTPDASLTEALVEMTRKGLGMTAIVDEQNHLLGVFTDGDLRRAVDDDDIDLRATPVTHLMTARPKTISTDRLAIEAARLMEAHKIHALLVVDEDNHVVGALNIHDLLRARVV